MVPKELGKPKPHIQDLCPLGWHSTATADLNSADLTFMRAHLHALVESDRGSDPR